MTHRTRRSIRIELGVAVGLRPGAGLFSRVADLARENHALQRSKVRQHHDREVAVEFLWRHASSMEQRSNPWVPHRIVRRTERAILVEAHPYSPESHRAGTPEIKRIRTYWIDRDEIERTGFARARSRKTVFYSSPHNDEATVRTTQSLNRLGLWWPFTEDDLRQAFRRRALQVHPDAGGSEERFVQLQADYQRALAAIERR